MENTLIVKRRAFVINKERIKHLNTKGIKSGHYILYWMQASQRTEYNHALEYAVRHANLLQQPLVVYFGLTDIFPEANARHYYFMLEGLKEVKTSLAKRGIAMVIKHTSPVDGAIELSEDASLVITDRGYLRIQKEWRETLAPMIECSLVQIESDIVVPVEEASPKEEYSAATFRPKLYKKLSQYLVSLRQENPKVNALPFKFQSIEINDVAQAVALLNIERSLAPSLYFRGGTNEAKRHLSVFIKKKLDRFQKFRNDPSRDYLSNMSPYLHFGQISPLYIALEIIKTESPSQSAFLEELLVRRELSMNFVYYNEEYDSFECIPGWAKDTLKAHEKDSREYIYTLAELENARTHDTYWNAAQNEMRITGKMHGYMRMYWGKKILEWTASPQKGFEYAIYLNNKYELDGRDPNGFAGVAWCFGKHDRPWAERPIFGKVRYMNDKGLRRKFDINAYVRKIEELHKS